MPYDDPEPDDPHLLVGVSLPGEVETVHDMAATLAEEFAQLGFTRDQILALFRSRFYAGAHAAWQALGDETIARAVDEAVALWGRVQVSIAEPVVTIVRRR